MQKDQIFEAIKDNAIDILPDLAREAITPEKSLKDLGANSLDRMDIMTQAMEDLDIAIPMMELADVTNISSLIDLLYEKANS